MTPQTVALQVPLSMGFSRQEYWSGLPRPPPGDIPNPGIEPRSPALQVDSLPALDYHLSSRHKSFSFKSHTVSLFMYLFNAKTKVDIWHYKCKL